MPLSDNARRQLDEIDAEERAVTDAEADAAADKLRTRLRIAGGLSEPTQADPRKPVITTEEAQATQTDKEELGELERRFKSDRTFAIAVRQKLEAIGHVPHPSWFKPKDLFSARIEFGDAGSVTISVVSAGNRMKILLSTRMLEIQRIVNELGREAAKFPNEDQVPIALVTERNKKLEEQAALSECDHFASIITAWDGPNFSWEDDNGKIKPMPLLRDFDLNDKEQADRAMSIYRRLPRKALELIEQGRKILDNYGIEEAIGTGNS